MSKVRGGIDKHLIDGIHHDVLRGNIFQIDAVDLPRHFFIVRHPRRCHQIGYLKRGVCCKGGGIVGRCGQCSLAILIHSSAILDGIAQATVVDFLDALHDLEQSSAAGNAVCFQRRGHSQADGFLGAACIGHDQISGQRIEMPSSALCGSVI